MAAVFEINVIYKGEKNFCNLLTALANVSINYAITSIETIDNWQYADYQLLTNINLKELIKKVILGKIIIINGIINEKYNFGMFIAMETKEIYNINIWVSTEYLGILDVDYITRDNIYIYYGN